MKNRSTRKRRSAQRTNPCGAFTVGLDSGDRSSRYCVLDEHGEAMLERSVATTKQGLDQVFGSMPRCRVALEVGTHSPWVNRHLARAANTRGSQHFSAASASSPSRSSST